jgi:hypothetical protein
MVEMQSPTSVALPHAAEVQEIDIGTALRYASFCVFIF